MRQQQAIISTILVMPSIDPVRSHLSSHDHLYILHLCNKLISSKNALEITNQFLKAKLGIQLVPRRKIYDGETLRQH